MRFRILFVGLATVTAVFVYRMAIQTPQPAFREEARADGPPREISGSKPAEPVPDPKASLRAHLLIIEPDWSNSPTAGEVKTDLERALANVPLPENLRRDLLKSGPRILFSEENVEYYQPQSCAELMAWLKRHELIRKQVPFPASEIMSNQAELMRNTPEMMKSLRNAAMGGDKAFVSKLQDQGELLAGPHPQEESRRPFVEEKKRWEWQARSDLSSRVIGVDSGRGDVSVELGNPDRGLINDLQVITREASLRTGESAFVSGVNWGKVIAYPAPEPARAGESAKTPGWPVIWFQAAELPNPGGVVPALRIPDRVEKPTVLLSNYLPKWEPIVHGDGSHANLASTDATDQSGEANPAIRRGEPVGGYSHPGDPTLQLIPSLLLIEPDWSKSPTAAEVKADLESALDSVALPDNLRAEYLLKSGSGILFAGFKAKCYQPRSCVEFVAWLDKHKLVRTRVSFPAHTLKRPESSLSGPPGFESVLVDAELLPIPKRGDSNPTPFIEIREKRKWQVFSHGSANLIEVYSGIERTQVELGKPNSDWMEHRRVFGKTFGRREGESLFVLGNLDPESYEEAVAAAATGTPDGEAASRPEALPVIWLQAIETLSEKGAAPKLHIPDRLDSLSTIHGNHVPQREPWATPRPGEQIVPPSNTPPTANSSPAPIPGSSKISTTRPETSSLVEPTGTTDSNQAGGGSRTLTSKRESDSLHALRAGFERLDARANSLAEEIRAESTAPTPGVDTAARREALRTAVNDAFIAGQKLHEAELAEFRERVQRLEQTIEQRSRNSEKVINRRVEDLLDPSLKWSEQDHSTGPKRGSSAADRSTGKSAEEIDGVWLLKGGLFGTGDSVRAVFWKGWGAVFIGDQRIKLHRVTIDLKKTPSRITLEDPTSKDFRHGIFEITGDRLRMTIVPQSAPIPDKFTDPLQEFERLSRDVPVTLPDAISLPGESASLQTPPTNELEGVWKVRAAPPGQPSVDETQHMQFVYWKNLCAVFEGDKLGTFYRVSIDRTKLPHQIRMTDAKNENSHSCIYEVANDRLRMHVVTETEPIPETLPDQTSEFERISREVPSEFRVAMATQDQKFAAILPPRKPGPPVTPKAARRPFPASVTVGLISEVREDGTVVVSCKEPGEIQVGEELVLYSREMEVRDQHTRAGWIEITRLENAETAIGLPFGLTRLQLENRFVDRQPKPGDIVERPIYQEPRPASNEKHEPELPPAPKSPDSQSSSALEGMWWHGKIFAGPSGEAAGNKSSIAFWKDGCVVLNGTERRQTYRVTLDLTRIPHVITLNAVGHGESRHGIYVIDGNRLYMSLVPQTQPIPETIKDRCLKFERASSTEFNKVIEILKTADDDAAAKRPRRKVPLATTVGLVSEVRDDGTLLVSSREPGELQVGNELILSYISKEGGGTYKPAGWIRITGLQDAATAVGEAFELPREQIENRYIERPPRVGDLVERAMTEKLKPVSDPPATIPKPD